MTRPDQTRPDQTTHVRKSLKEFLKQHDRYNILRGTKRFLINTFYWPFYRPFDPWYHDRVHRNPAPARKSDRIPYIIRRKQDKAGLFSYLMTAMGGIAYAEKKGYIPVIDMKNYPNTYLYDSEVGHVNAWEYYFEQPDTLSLEEALSCRKYILSKDTAFHTCPSPFGPLTSIYYNEDGTLDYWSRLFKKYIHFTQPVLDGLERELKKFAGKRVLGVSLRGTDYTGLKLHWHPVQPTIEQGLSKTREVFGTGSYDAVYLATEDKNIILAFREAFGEKLILPDRDAIDYDASRGKWITECFDDRRQNDKYLTGLEYLVSILVLTKCSGLITSLTNGAAGAICLSEGFEYLYVFDFGVYP